MNGSESVELQRRRRALIPFRRPAASGIRPRFQNPEPFHLPNEGRSVRSQGVSRSSSVPVVGSQGVQDSFPLLCLEYFREAPGLRRPFEVEVELLDRLPVLGERNNAMKDVTHFSDVPGPRITDQALPRLGRQPHRLILLLAEDLQKVIDEQRGVPFAFAHRRKAQNITGKAVVQIQSELTA